QLSERLCVRLQLLVPGNSDLQGSQALRPRVRLTEHAETEQRDHDQKRRNAEERDEQLRPNLRRQTGDGPDDRVVRAARQQPTPDRSSSSPAHCLSLTQEPSASALPL